MGPRKTLKIRKDEQASLSIQGWRRHGLNFGVWQSLYQAVLHSFQFRVFSVFRGHLIFLETRRELRMNTDR